MNESMIDLVVPSVGESVTEVEVGEWLKQPGEAVRKDENLVVLETDKATLELSAPADGRLDAVLQPRGARVKVGDVLARIVAGAAGAASAAPAPAPAPAKAPKAAAPRVMPAAAQLLAEKGLPATAAEPTGPGERVLKEDAQKAVAKSAAKPAVAPPVPAPAPTPVPMPPMPPAPPLPAARPAPTEVFPTPGAEETASAEPLREDKVVPMSLLRRKIAERLVSAQHQAALLTTFNEVDMSQVIALRKEFQEKFQERHHVKLGFMSFFVKAVTEAVKLAPGLNAEIRGQEIVYHQYCDIGIAIGGGRGLVVPVLRNAERLSFAQIESAIGAFAQRAKENTLRPEDLAGGTFTITNGGVYGSMLSTPLVNPPQSGVLGMHAIQDRPMAVNGQVVIRPVMYLALTYDHRVVDGREAVTFLKRIKDLVENPTRLLLEV
jgi:2-oxoglutarate dehydrogenase E2 component (dihydrolipoamide succinyltransferase)